MTNTDILLELLESQNFAAAEELLLRDPEVLQRNDVVPELHPGWSLLQYFAFYGDESELRFLLEHGARVNNATTEGLTALHLASSVCNYNAVKLLLKHGADPNITDQLGHTPLHLAATANIIAARQEQVVAYVETVKKLVSEGARPNVTDKDGKTPLDGCNEMQHPMRYELENLLKFQSD